MNWRSNDAYAVRSVYPWPAHRERQAQSSALRAAFSANGSPFNNYQGVDTVEEGAREAVRVALLGPGPTANP